MIKNKKVDYPWGHMIWWLDGENIAAPDISTAKMVVNPNSKSEKHLHNNCYEFIAITEGNVTLFLNEVPNKLTKDNTILISPNTPHYVENISQEKAEMTIVYSTAVRNYTLLK